MLYEYPEFTEEEFFNLEPTTLIGIKDTVYFAVELLEPQIYYWDCNKNKYVHVIYKFAKRPPAVEAYNPACRISCSSSSAI